MKRLIVDLDNTICHAEKGDYKNAIPHPELIQQLKTYKEQGFEIVISTSRNMRTYEGNIGKITVNTLPIILDWLKKHDVPHDEIYLGKPWCGLDGFYIDDRSVRPREFNTMTYEEIIPMIKRDQQ